MIIFEKTFLLRDAHRSLIVLARSLLGLDNSTPIHLSR